MRGEAEEFFHGLRDEWWDMVSTLSYATDKMESAFSRSFTSAQVSEFFNRHKNATGASESLVMHASLELRSSLPSQYDRKRSDFVVHALEIAHRAQRTKKMKGEHREQERPR